MAQRTPLQLLSGLVAKFTSSDTVDPVNLGTLTPDGTKFLRDDGVWHPVMLYRATYGVGSGIISVPVLEGETDGVTDTKFKKLVIFAVAGGGGGGWRATINGNASGGGGGAGIKLEIFIPPGTKAGTDIFDYVVGDGGDGGHTVNPAVSGPGLAGGDTILETSSASGDFYRGPLNLLTTYEIKLQGGQPGTHSASGTAINGGLGGNLQYLNAALAYVNNTNIEAAAAVVQNATGLQKHFIGGSGCGVSVANATSAAMPGSSIYGGGGGGSTSAASGNPSLNQFGVSYTFGRTYGLGGRGCLTDYYTSGNDGMPGVIICEWS
jgi:hypothetical protein